MGKSGYLPENYVLYKSTTLPLNVREALLGANSPSAINVYTTLADLSGSIGVLKFLDLQDVPATSYGGLGGWLPIVNSSETGLDFVPTTTVVNVDTSLAKFTNLTDVPSSYTGQGKKIVSVKEDETGLEFGESLDFLDHYVDSLTISSETSGSLPSTSNLYNIIKLIAGRTGDLPDLFVYLGSMAGKKFWLGTMDEYNAIPVKDSNTIYHIEEEEI